MTAAPLAGNPGYASTTQPADCFKKPEVVAGELSAASLHFREHFLDCRAEMQLSALRTNPAVGPNK